MAEKKHNPKDINKFFRNLTPEQSAAFGSQLGKHLNSVYINAEKDKKKSASTKKKSGK